MSHTIESCVVLFPSNNSGAFLNSKVVPPFENFRPITAIRPHFRVTLRENFEVPEPKLCKIMALYDRYVDQAGDKFQSKASVIVQ